MGHLYPVKQTTVFKQIFLRFQRLNIDDQPGLPPRLLFYLSVRRLPFTQCKLSFTNSALPPLLFFINIGYLDNNGALKNFLIIGFLCLLSGATFGQATSQFITLDVKQGLSNNNVWSINQARYGIWISTENGLNRYDGLSKYNYAKDNFEILALMIVPANSTGILLRYGGFREDAQKRIYLVINL